MQCGDATPAPNRTAIAVQREFDDAFVGGTTCAHKNGADRLLRRAPTRASNAGDRQAPVSARNAARALRHLPRNSLAHSAWAAGLEIRRFNTEHANLHAVRVTL